MKDMKGMKKEFLVWLSDYYGRVRSQQALSVRGGGRV